MKRQRPRYQLREDDLRHGQQQQDYADRNGLGGGWLKTRRCHPRRKGPGNGCLRVGTQDQSGYGDAYLAGGNIPIEGFRLFEIATSRGERITLLGEMLDRLRRALTAANIGGE